MIINKKTPKKTRLIIHVFFHHTNKYGLKISAHFVNGFRVNFFKNICIYIYSI